MHCIQVLNSRDPVPPANVTAFRAWAEAITEDEFETSILPVLIRMAKRSPDSVVRSTALLLHMLRLSSDKFAAGLMKEMLGMIRHPKESVR